MFLKSLYFWRTYLGYVIVAILGTFLFAASLVPITGQKVQQNLNSTMEIAAQTLSGVVGQSLQRLDYQGISETTASVSSLASLRITVIDGNGVVLADSHENPFDMDNHLRRPEIQAALSNGSGRAQRYSFTLEEEFLYLAKPVYRGEQLMGFTRVAKSSSELDEEIRQSQEQIFRNAAIVTFIILLIAFYLSARQAAVVHELAEIAKEISQGNFDRRIPEGSSLGLRKIAKAINHIARSSAHSLTEITSDRNRLSTVFTCMVEGVIDVDMDQNILHINEAAAKLLMVKEKECVGKPLWQEIRNQEITSALDKAIKTLSVIKTQMRLNRKTDQLVVDIYAASLSNDDGVPIGAVLVLHDITELENLERVRTDFVANASHELKTPITAIRGMAETLLGDGDIDKETMNHFMERVHAQSLRLSQLIADLMTLSRLESTQSEEAFTRINFVDLTLEALKQARITAEGKGLILTDEITDQELPIFGDRQNMNQLVDNLLDNAIKYTEEPGTISVRLNSEAGWAVLEVQDTGLGISPQYQQRVFERFYRVDKSRSQSLGGTGLGLSIVKNIAEKHGGTVSVKSQLGSGTTFIFRLPLGNLAVSDS
jgi:two-component system, OmpR family, phosphate regulon sensor histidine kinase PhoR